MAPIGSRSPDLAGPRGRRHVALGATLLAACLAWPGAATAQGHRGTAAPGDGAPAAQGVVSSAPSPWVNFESGPVRPLLLSPDGDLLYALNTPDARLEIYATGAGAPTPQLTYLDSVFTGLEPVAMALHPEDPSTLFVANYVSDSIAVVDLDALRVVAVIDVGDEPSDVIVVGDELWVATARAPLAPGLVDPGAFVENAVVVAQAHPPYAVLDVLGVPAHRPRALLHDGPRVWVMPQDSGNHTTSLSEFQTDALGLHPTDVLPGESYELNPALIDPQLSTSTFTITSFFPFLMNGWEVPDTGRIVRDSDWPGQVPQLPDHDLLSIDVGTRTLDAASVTGLGTTLLALAQTPDGRLWVANTDARNLTRFEPEIKGAAFDNRVSVVGGGPGDGAGARAVEAVLSFAPPFTTQQHAQPAALAVSSGLHGDIVYVAALGTDHVLALDADTGALIDEIATAGIPLGLAVDGAAQRLYVLTRADKTLRAYDIAAGHVQVGRPAPLAYDPEPAGAAAGRRLLYDARTGSGAGTGNMSCASCHVFGHADSLAWDLGDPGGGLGWFYTDLLSQEASFGGASAAGNKTMLTHPMKGAMVTQSLRGLFDFKGPPLHWRGDRRFFQMFRGAFQGLLGGSGISPADMQAFTQFTRSLRFPPNPLQPKDREYTGTAASGRDLYGMNPDVPGKVYTQLTNLTCIDCHEGNFADGTDYTGSQRTVNVDGESQLFNSATLRGNYEKLDRHLTGFGLVHDGSIADVVEFLSAEFQGQSVFPLLSQQDRQDLADFIRAWDSGTAPLVGGQVFGDAGSAELLFAWLDLAAARAAPDVRDVDVTGRARYLPPAGPPFDFGLVLEPAGSGADGEAGDVWLTDIGRRIPDAELRAALADGRLELLLTAVLPGTGTRFGVDRDEDGLLDGVERAWGSRAHDPDSDDDGYADGAELGLGGHPLVPDARLGDVTPPEPDSIQALDAFATTATLVGTWNEPVTLAVSVQLADADGTAPLFEAGASALRRRHEVFLTGLPAGSDLVWQATATDRDGNTHVASGPFATAPPMLHVADISLEVNSAAPLILVARVTVVDQDGVPMVGVPVKGMWSGDIGAAEHFPYRTTNAFGTAVFGTGVITPGVLGEVTFSPAFVGHATDTTSAWYVGNGGQAPTFFYNQSANLVNFRTLDLSQP